MKRFFLSLLFPLVAFAQFTPPSPIWPEQNTKGNFGRILDTTFASFENPCFRNSNVDQSTQTTVDTDSASGQKSLHVASSTNMASGDIVVVNKGGAREEACFIEMVTAGPILSCESNLTYSHTAAQGDNVDKTNAIGPLTSGERYTAFCHNGSGVQSACQCLMGTATVDPVYSTGTLFGSSRKTIIRPKTASTYLSCFATSNNTVLDVCNGFNTTAPYADDCTGGTACFRLNETTGDVVDAIAAITAGVNGSPTYSVAASGRFALISPGISFGTNNFFLKNSDTVELDADLQDFTVEIFYKTTNTGTQYLFDTRADVGAKGYAILYNGAELVFNLKPESGSSTTISATLDPSVFSDGNIHKLRLGVDRDGLTYFYFDHALINSTDTTVGSGINVKAHNVMIGAKTATLNNFFMGTMYFLKVTNGSYQANMGGPNGG